MAGIQGPELAYYTRVESNHHARKNPWFTGLCRRRVGPPLTAGRPPRARGGGNPVDGVSRGGGLSPPAQAPHRDASGTRLGSDDRGRANRARPLRRPGINAGPARLRPTPQEGDDEPER